MDNNTYELARMYDEYFIFSNNSGINKEDIPVYWTNYYEISNVLTNYYSNITPLYVDVIDLNRDGAPDFIKITNGAVFAYYNWGNGDYIAYAPYVTTNNLFKADFIKLADVNGDGAPDFIGVSTNYCIVIPGDGCGQFNTNRAQMYFYAFTNYNITSNVAPPWIRVVDINSDSAADIVAVYTNHANPYYGSKLIVIPGLINQSIYLDTNKIKSYPSDYFNNNLNYELANINCDSNIDLFLEGIWYDDYLNFSGDNLNFNPVTSGSGAAYDYPFKIQKSYANLSDYIAFFFNNYIYQFRFNSNTMNIDTTTSNCIESPVFLNQEKIFANVDSFLDDDLVVFDGTHSYLMYPPEKRQGHLHPRVAD